jgi:hypothetical protein
VAICGEKRVKIGTDMGITVTQWRKAVRKLDAEGVPITTIANYYGINHWYIREVLDNEDFVPSKKLRKQLGLVLKEYPPRVTIYLGWDAFKIAARLYDVLGPQKAGWVMQYLSDRVEEV